MILTYSPSPSTGSIGRKNGQSEQSREEIGSKCPTPVHPLEDHISSEMHVLHVSVLVSNVVEMLFLKSPLF
jgi:hypothetical protein